MRRNEGPSPVPDPRSQPTPVDALSVRGVPAVDMHSSRPRKIIIGEDDHMAEGTYNDYMSTRSRGRPIVDAAAGSPGDRQSLIYVAGEPILRTARAIEENKAKQGKRDGSVDHDDAAPALTVVDLRGGDIDVLREKARGKYEVKETTVTKYFENLPASVVARAAAKSYKGDQDAAEGIYRDALRRVAKRQGIDQGAVRLNFSQLADAVAQIRNLDEPHDLPAGVEAALTKPPLFKEGERSALGIDLYRIQEHTRTLAERVAEAERMYDPEVLQAAANSPARPHAEFITLPEEVDHIVREAVAATLLPRAAVLRASRRVIVSGAPYIDFKDFGQLRELLGNPTRGTNALYIFPMDGVTVSHELAHDGVSGRALFGSNAVKVYMYVDEQKAVELQESAGTNSQLHATGITDEVSGSEGKGRNGPSGEQETNSGDVTRSGGLPIAYGTDAQPNVLPEHMYRQRPRTVTVVIDGHVSGPKPLFADQPVGPQIQAPNVPQHVRDTFEKGHPAPGTENRPALLPNQSTTDALLKSIRSNPKKIENPITWLTTMHEEFVRRGIWHGTTIPGPNSVSVGLLHHEWKKYWEGWQNNWKREHPEDPPDMNKAFAEYLVKTKDFDLTSHRFFRRVNPPQIAQPQQPEASRVPQQRPAPAIDAQQQIRFDDLNVPQQVPQLDRTQSGSRPAHGTVEQLKLIRPSEREYNANPYLRGAFDEMDAIVRSGRFKTPEGEKRYNDLYHWVMTLPSPERQAAAQVVTPQDRTTDDFLRAQREEIRNRLLEELNETMLTPDEFKHRQALLDAIEEEIRTENRNKNRRR